MDLEEFAELHVPALEVDEARFNLEIAAMTAAAKEKPAGFRHWTLGGPGHCAIQWPGRAIVLANLDQDECRKLARATMQIEYPGVRGSGQTPHWFAQQATAMGADFEEPIPQRIHVLSGPPRYPGVAGSARSVSADDTPLLFEWLVAFHNEAVPHDPPPQQANVEKAAASGRFLFWTVDDEPVSVAAIARRLRHTGAVSSVYTPPEQRGRGYAGSATAAAENPLEDTRLALPDPHPGLVRPNAWCQHRRPAVQEFAYPIGAPPGSATSSGLLYPLRSPCLSIAAWTAALDCAPATSYLDLASL